MWRQEPSHHCLGLSLLLDIPVSLWQQFVQVQSNLGFSIMFFKILPTSWPRCKEISTFLGICNSSIPPKSVFVFYYCVTSYHMFHGLRHYPLFSLSFCRSEVQALHEWVLYPQSHKAEIQVSARLHGCIPFWRLWQQNRLSNSSRLLGEFSFSLLED